MDSDMLGDEVYFCVFRNLSKISQGQVMEMKAGGIPTTDVGITAASTPEVVQHQGTR
jgi:hypothetical protein